MDIGLILGDHSIFSASISRLQDEEYRQEAIHFANFIDVPFTQLMPLKATQIDLEHTYLNPAVI